MAEKRPTLSLLSKTDEFAMLPSTRHAKKHVSTFDFSSLQRVEHISVANMGPSFKFPRIRIIPKRSTAPPVASAVCSSSNHMYQQHLAACA